MLCRMSMLTFGALCKHDSALWHVDNDRETRVVVRTPSGMQIGLPGVGENENKLTFPRRYLVGDALKAQWIRFASESDTLELPVGFQRTWWAISEVQPKSLVHCDGSIAGLDQPMGLIGNYMLAVAQSYEKLEVEEIPCADVDSVDTPPTPDHF